MEVDLLALPGKENPDGGTSGYAFLWKNCADCESLSPMAVLRSSSVLLCFALSSLIPTRCYTASTHSLDSSWKPYFNVQGKYCVNYPARWYKSDAFDGSGLYVMAGAKKHSRATGEIDIAIFHEPVIGSARQINVSLNDSFQRHVEGLKKFVRAERMQVLDQHPMDLAGNVGLFTKDSYYDPQDRSTWVEEVLFVMHRDDVYRLELECKADQIGRFEPVFAHFVTTLHFDCGAPH